MMLREKQIEEMANILWHIPINYFLNNYNDCQRIAEYIRDVKQHPFSYIL